METLHTILLGPYKYLTRMVMGRLTRDQKVEVAARMTAIVTLGSEEEYMGTSHATMGRLWDGIIRHGHKLHCSSLHHT